MYRSSVSCILYANDIILLFLLFVCELMLKIVSNTALELSLELNVNKSYCIAIGSKLKKQSRNSELNSKSISWVKRIKYIKYIHFLSKKCLCWLCDVIKRKICTASNCVFSKCHNVSKWIQLKLQETYCLPILTYAGPALNFDKKQVQQLNVSWNNFVKFLVLTDGNLYNVLSMASVE